MRSIIILEVEHGEDTDLLDAWIAHILYAIRKGDGEYAGSLIDYTVRVDLPATFALDSLGQAQHDSHDLSRFEL